jgi:cation diffusion facilitator CzcD-associated flavoprotein CzcO
MNASNNSVNNDNNEHFDVLVVGAGLSGIGSAYHLKTQLPDKSFCVLDGMESFGGTWLTHNYPGVRSDSDLFTFGYRFKPWTGSPIAKGAEILNYMHEVIDENHLDQHIRYNHHVLGASWDSVNQLWTITAFKKDSKETVVITANFLWMCQGYYNHEKGYTPDWNGKDDYQGLLVHPQDWPKDLHYKDKKYIYWNKTTRKTNYATKLRKKIHRGGSRIFDSLFYFLRGIWNRFGTEMCPQEQKRN